MRLHLVDGEGLNQILEMDWNQFISQMESSSLRSLRPEPDARLGRDFDIDCEAEFLDLSDEISGEGIANEDSFREAIFIACNIYKKTVRKHFLQEPCSNNIWW